jgi:putative membrane protein insertion efficiency factor
MIIRGLLLCVLLCGGAVPLCAAPGTPGAASDWDPACLLSVPHAAADGSASGVQAAFSLWFTAYRRLISDVRGPVCNFSPSCSHYSQEAIAEYGFVRGVVMTGDRLIRCHCCILPGFYPRGVTPVADYRRRVYIDPVDDNALWPHAAHPSFRISLP